MTYTTAVAAAVAEASMSPVRHSSRSQPLPPMSKSYQRTLHVSYILQIYILFKLIYLVII